MIKGIAIDLGGAEYTVPPLSLAAVEAFQDRLAGFDGTLSAPSVGLVLDVAHAALKRNYVTITRAELAELIDLGNMGEVFEAVMDVSGLRRKESEAGKAKAAAKR